MLVFVGTMLALRRWGPGRFGLQGVGGQTAWGEKDTSQLTHCLDLLHGLGKSRGEAWPELYIPELLMTCMHAKCDGLSALATSATGSGVAGVPCEARRPKLPQVLLGEVSELFPLQ